MSLDVISFLNKSFLNVEFFKVGQHLIPIKLLDKNTLNTPFKAGFFYPADVVQIAGKDSKNFLQGLITNNINLLDKMPALRSLITNQKGKILFDVFIQNPKDASYIIYCQPNEQQKLLDFLNYYHVAEELNITIQEPTHLLYIFDETRSKLNLPNIFFNDDRHKLTLYKAQDLTEDLLSKENIDFLGIEEFDNLRPIFGLARSAVDFDANNYPQEASLESFVDYKKGCFIGQEPISRMFNKAKPTKKLCRLQSKRPLNPKAAILSEDRNVGMITCSSDIETEKGYFSLGFVKTRVIAANSILTSLDTPLEISDT